MMSESSLEARLRRAEARLRLILAAVVVLAVGVGFGFVRAWSNPEVLTVRGLVVVDEAGNERIVLGAPMASISGDERLAETIGMAVVDAEGLVNIIVGGNAPMIHNDGTVSPRMAETVGLIVYDPEGGGERGGLGAAADGTAAMCLDHQEGGEAACVFVSPRLGYTGVLLNAPPGAGDRQRALLGVQLSEDTGGRFALHDHDGSRVSMLPEPR